MMDTLEQQADPKGSGPPRRALTVRLVAALVLCSSIATVWLLLQSSRETPATGGQSAAATPGHGAAGEAPFDDRFPATIEGAPEGLPPALAPVTPIEVPPDVGAATADGWHDIRGVAVRASDESPVVAATISAVLRDAATDGADQPLQTRTGADGSFTLHVPGEVENFRVLLPVPRKSRFDAELETKAFARIEWAGGGASNSEVRLVLETGWKLDVHLIDGENRPRAGVAVTGSGRTAKSDAEGRCALLDLPVNGAPVTLTLRPASGGKTTTYVVDAPEAGSLRKDETFKVP